MCICVCVCVSYQTALIGLLRLQEGAEVLQQVWPALEQRSQSLVELDGRPVLALTRLQHPQELLHLPRILLEGLTHLQTGSRKSERGQREVRERSAF